MIVTAIYLHATEKAVLLDIDGEEIWVPLSVLNGPDDVDCYERGDEGDFDIAGWFAKKEGL
jgi:hypothetical protein